MSKAKDGSLLAWTVGLVSALLFAAAWGCGGSVSTEPPAASFDPVLAMRLQAQLDQSREQFKVLGAVVGVQSANGALWFGASGSATPDQKVALRTTDRFRVASITKLFTAALVMQLVQEQRLRLEDTLDTWYPSLPDARQITIRMLLTHTSGIAEYIDMVNQRKHWEPDALIDVAVAGGLLYAPGSQFTYSNANYILLARVAEKITGSSYRAELRNRLLEPLGLDQTFLEGEEEIPGGFVRGGLRLGTGYQDYTNSIDASVIWSAGGLVSNAADMLSWARALFVGQVLRPESLAVLTAPAVLNDGTEISDAGSMDIVRAASGTRYGHFGGIPGFASSLFFLIERQLAVVALCNDWGFTPDMRLEGWVIGDDMWLLLAPA